MSQDKKGCQADQPASLQANTPDIIAMYKNEFFHAYGQLLTQIVEGGIYENDQQEFRAFVEVTTVDIMRLRGKALEGEDTENNWLEALLKLISVANHAAGFIGLAHIGMQASSLVVDGANIMKKMKAAQEGPLADKLASLQACKQKEEV